MPGTGYPPLDVLIYAHDGRGLGHVSRSVAIGLAVRRLHPELRTLLLTGARGCAELIGPAPLDWIKLPAYATRVIDGRSRGVDGPAGFADADAGRLRAALIDGLVGTLRPRLVLADHAPQGKHRELLAALARPGPQWLLGIRAVLGAVPQLGSALARDVFSRHYAGALWFGDSAVLGHDEPAALAGSLGAAPDEIGYVSRLTELEAGGWLARPARPTLAGTVALPWAGERTAALAGELAAAIAGLDRGLGAWRVFVDAGDQDAWQAACRAFAPLEHCTVEPAGESYPEALLASRAAVVFGGYNSLTDVLHARVPALVILRGMADGEQERHVARLIAGGGAPLVSLPEAGADRSALGAMLGTILGTAGAASSACADPARCTVALDGAARAAHAIAARLRAG